jgi:hypothetical protein
MDDELDESEFYTFHNPTKPIMMPDTNKIMLVAMNPFSDSIEFKIHASHILSMGNLDEVYLDIYMNSVDTILNKIKNRNIVKDEYPDDYDENLNTFEKSQMIH